MVNNTPRRKEKAPKKEVRNQAFIKMLKEARCRNNMTQAQLAEKLEVETATVSAWEQGNNFPNIDTLLKLPEILKCDLDYLIGRLPPDEPTHEIQLIHNRTGLSVESIIQLLESKKLSDWSKDPNNWKETKGVYFGDIPAYLFYKRLSTGEILSKILDNERADELLKYLEDLIFPDRFYSSLFRNSRMDTYETPTLHVGFETVTEESHFNSLQYRTTMIFSKILDDMTHQDLDLEDIKRITGVMDDSIAREYLRYRELQKKACKQKNNKRKDV